MEQKILDKHNEAQVALRKLETEIQELFNGHYEIGQIFSHLGHVTYVLSLAKNGKSRVLVQIGCSPRQPSKESYHLNNYNVKLQTLDITLANVKDLQPVESLVEALGLDKVDPDDDIPF